MKDIQDFFKKITNESVINDFDIIELFADNLRHFRKQKELTLEQLSFKANLNRNYLSDIENQRRNVSLRAILRIANGLEIPVEQLFKKR